MNTAMRRDQGNDATVRAVRNLSSTGGGQPIRQETTTLRRLMKIAWRRRHFIIIPVLAMLPLSILAAALLPVPYVTRTLLLLQEPGTEGPPGSDFAVPERIAERAAGLDAILKSDDVLGKVALDIGSPDPQRTIRQFRTDLSLKLIGLDLVQIELEDSSAARLGKRLELIVIQFLDTLIEGRGESSAGQLILLRRQHELAKAQSHLRETRQALANVQLVEQRTALEARLPQAEQDVATAQARLDDANARLSDSGSGQFVRILSAPERIRIVDWPKDPVVPERPRSLYIVFGMLASVLLGILLAWGAEQLDPQINDPGDFAALAGVAVIAELSDFSTPARPEQTTPYRRFPISVLLILLLFGLFIFLFLRFAPDETRAMIESGAIRLFDSLISNRW